MFVVDSDNDWVDPQIHTLWQGVAGTNNPCPSGFRLPTKDEWVAEVALWGSNNAAGAFASSLKLPLAGIRDDVSGVIVDEGIEARYWSSSVGTTIIQKSKRLGIDVAG